MKLPLSPGKPWQLGPSCNSGMTCKRGLAIICLDYDCWGIYGRAHKSRKISLPCCRQNLRNRFSKPYLVLSRFVCSVLLWRACSFTDTVIPRNGVGIDSLIHCLSVCFGTGAGFLPSRALVHYTHFSPPQSSVPSFLPAFFLFAAAFFDSIPPGEVSRFFFFSSFSFSLNLTHRPLLAFCFHTSISVVVVLVSSLSLSLSV